MEDGRKASFENPVSVTMARGIALITIDNPPVNALSHAVRQGLWDALAAVESDGTVAAAVLRCAGRSFVAGADITELGKPPRAPLLGELLERIDRLSKPVVAAIHGSALGGGLELALSCHYRVAIESALLGLPEVKLGLLPGAGGTQRLPRAVGPQVALDMIVRGEPITAAKAESVGLVDLRVTGDLTEEALRFAQDLAPGSLRRLSRDDAGLAGSRADPRPFEDSAAALLARARGATAPSACVEAVRAAFTLPFEEGLARERALFRELLEGPQSRALRHLFFAERRAAKTEGPASDGVPRPIDRVAVIGAGTMGAGIAMCFASAGVPVTLVDADEKAIGAGLTRIEQTYAAAAARSGRTPEERKAAAAPIAGSTDMSAVADADLVVEAVFEDMELKRRIFADLDRLTRPGAILATNTSTLDVDEIASATSRPQDVVGLHFFSPANVMRLLEVVRARETSAATLAAALAIARRIGKVAAIVGVCDGFVGNRMLARRNLQCEHLLLHGALPEEVDRAATEFGLAMGPLAVGDLAGLDVGWRIRQSRGIRAEIADALFAMGRFGQKTGKGYYRYEEGSRAPQPDPEVEALIRTASERLGIARRPIAPAEIVDRLVLPVVNEGARILAEKIAARPGDIDVIWVHGYGWPAWRGGPMHHADEVGLAEVARRLESLAVADGDETLRPAPLLRELAAAGRSFGDLNSPVPS